MPERMVKRARNYPPNLYFMVPFVTQVKYEVKKGDKIKCLLNRVVDSQGNLITRVNREIICEVAKRDGRFYLPSSLVKEFGFTGVEFYEFILQRLIKPNGVEVEIYPKEKVERDIIMIKEEA